MKDYKSEIRERFGNTDTYIEYSEKTADYTEDKWQQASDGLNAVFARFSECKRSGAAPDSPSAQELVKELQNHITENYYTCTNEILAGLGQMYVAEERFKTNIDKHARGTAAFAADAISVFCRAK